MKTFRNNKLGFLLGIFFIAAICIIVLQLNANSKRDSAEIASTLAATTGDLAALYLAAPEEGVCNNCSSTVVKDLIRRQAMVLLTLNLDVREFDSAGFEGLCRLAANRDVLFPVSLDRGVEGLSNKLLNSNFANLAKIISNESLARSNRPADQHSCPGFRKK